MLSAAVGTLCGLHDPADRRPVREHVRGHDQALNRLPQAYQGGRRRRRGRPTRWEHALGAWRVWRASAPPSAALRAAQAAATRAEVTREYRSNCVRVGLWRCRPMDKWTRGPCLRCWVESLGALGCTACRPRKWGVVSSEGGGDVANIVTPRSELFCAGKRIARRAD